jgi:imidazolonepropionase-like amidohydrolase
MGDRPAVTIVYRGAAFADGRSPTLELDVTVVVTDGRITWMGHTDEAPDPGGARVIDAGGTTLVPGMVDAHSHLTLPGGSHWIDRGFDPAPELEQVAEENAGLAMQAGVRWLRDVGSPMRDDPAGGTRALALQVRDRWRARGRDVPYLRAAGTWISKEGVLPDGLAVAVEDADALQEAVERQLDDGADLVKLYMDGPDRHEAPWTVHELRKAVDTARSRGARVTAHATGLAGARVCADAHVDAIEHGSELDLDIAATMAEKSIFVVPTLAVMASWQTFAHTTRIPRFVEEESRQMIAERKQTATESVRIARAAGVPIAAGTDFGGGSLRANQMAWEIESLVEAGLEPWEALAAATWRGGELLGEADAGVVRTGGPADFFFVHGDPLTDPAALWRVWRIA